jgi:hypothetical protein
MALARSMQRAADVLQFFPASLHAGVTDLGADAAVLVMACMEAALFCASTAGNDAGLQDAADYVVVCFRPARGN